LLMCICFSIVFACTKEGAVGPKGLDGLAGSKIHSGNTSPNASLGFNGDYYLNDKLLPANQLEYRDTPPSLTEGVYYQVLSVDTSGNYNGTNIQFVFAYDSIPPAVPSGLNALVDTTGVVKLSWNMDYADYVQGYRVFVSNSKNADFSPLNSDGLVAVDGNNNHSEFSEILTVQQPKMVKDPAPVIGDYEVKSNAVYFSWVLPNHIDVKEIHVLRRAKSDSIWQNIATLGKSQRSYRDSSVRESLNYEYAVATVDFENRRSEISYPLNVFVYASENPAPEGFKISTEGDGRLLSWNRPPNTDVKYYILYRDNGEGLEQFDSVDGELIQYNLGKDDSKNYGIRAVYNDATKSKLIKLQ
jgi:hypothetical protein